MSQELSIAGLLLVLLLAGLVPAGALGAQDVVLERLRRIGRGEWVGRPRIPDAVPFAPQIRWAALRHELSPSLLAALVRAESAFDPRAVSWAGAQGLGQLMPSTALDLGVDDPLDPESNLDGSAHYLSLQLRRFGDVRTALAAYHAGPERAATRRWPVVTRQYVARVMRFEREYRRRQLP